jgi:hypothetical protein
MFARGFVGWGKPGATEYGVPPLTPCVVSARGRTAPSNRPDFAAVHESAFGTKRTFEAYDLESAFGGKADIEI